MKLRSIHSGYEHNGHLVQNRVRTNQASHCQAIEQWHFHIQQNQVRMALFCHTHSLFSILRFDHATPIHVQQNPEHFTSVSVIFNDQHKWIFIVLQIR